MKQFVNDNPILTQLFPQINDLLDAVTEENMSDDMRNILKPDAMAHDRYAQLLKTNTDGHATMAEMIHMLTGKTPTPEYSRYVECMMHAVMSAAQ